MWPFYRIRFDDGSHFDYFGETEAMRREITRLAGASEVAGYDAFMREAMVCLKLGYEELGTTSFVSLVDLIAAMPSMVRMQAWKTIYSMARRHFKNEKLRQVFSFHPLLIGGNPFSVTQVYSLITGLEREYGVHSAMGGTGHCEGPCPVGGRPGRSDSLQRRGGSYSSGRPPCRGRGA
jgi:phytoene desaturase